MKKQRLLSILLVICLAVSMFSVSAGAIDVSNFKDVKESDWFYDHVKFVTSKGYFEGVSDTEFAPKDTMTRAMFVTVLARVEGVKVDNTKSSFSDVPANTWYTGAVAWAAENKIVDGITDTEFAPNAAVTREQMCTIMERYITNCGKTVEGKAKVDSFNDVEKVSSWAAKSVELCRKLGLIDGFEDGSFRPTETSTRAQVAAVETRLCEVVTNEGSNPGSGPSGPSGPVNPGTTYTDYIFNAVNAAGQDSVALVRDIIASLANYTGLTTVDTAISVRDFTANTATNGSGARPQSVVATATLSSALAREVVSIAISYARQIVGGTLSINDVKALVRDVLNDIEAEFGIDFSDIDRDAIVNAVYTYAMNNVAPIWANFNDGNGKYYTGNVTVTVPGAAPVVINVSDATGASFSGNKTATVKSVAIAIAKQAFQTISDPNNPHNIDANYDGWYEQVGAAANVIFTFSAPANDYAEHTDNFAYEYPFTLLLKLDGQGLVQYKYDGGANVKLYISQANQDRYEAAVERAVSEALNNATVVNTLKSKLNDLINDYLDLTNGPLASQVPSSVGDTLRDEIEDTLKDVIKAWIEANAGLDLTGGPDDGIEGSYFYEKLWNNRDIGRNDNAFNNLEIAIRFAIANEVDAQFPNAVAELKAEVKDEVDTQEGAGTFDSLSAAEKEDAYAEAVESLGVTGVTASNWEAKFKDYLKAEIEASVDFNGIRDTAISYIENNAYMTYIEKATNLKKFDTMDDVRLGNLATALQNTTLQGYINSFGASSYLVQVADLLGRLPAGATLTLKQNGTTVASISSAQVAAIQSANTPVAVCNAIANLLNTTGLSTLSISDFAAGMDVTVGYNSRTFTFGFVIEAA